MMIITRPMLNRMLDHTRLLGRMGRRDYLMLRMLWETGITVSELVKIRRYDLDMFKYTLRVRGKHARIIDMDRKLCDQVAFYRDLVIGYLRTDTSRDALFPYDQDVPFTVGQLRTLLHHYQRMAGVEEDGA